MSEQPVMIKMEDMYEAPLAKTDLSAATVTVQPASNRAQLLVSKWHHSLRRSNSPLVESDSIESLPSQKYKQFILTKIDLWIHVYFECGHGFLSLLARPQRHLSMGPGLQDLLSICHHFFEPKTYMCCSVPSKMATWDKEHKRGNRSGHACHLS